MSGWWVYGGLSHLDTCRKTNSRQYPSGRKDALTTNFIITSFRAHSLQNLFIQAFDATSTFIHQRLTFHCARTSPLSSKRSLSHQTECWVSNHKRTYSAPYFHQSPKSHLSPTNPQLTNNSQNNTHQTIRYQTKCVLNPTPPPPVLATSLSVIVSALFLPAVTASEL